MGRAILFVFENVENNELHAASIILRAIAHPLRLKMIAFIDKNKSITVNKIFTSLNMDQSIASQQLNILRTANLVKTKREGKYIYYSLNYANIERVNGLIEKFRGKG